MLCHRYYIVYLAADITKFYLSLTHTYTYPCDYCIRNVKCTPQVGNEYLYFFMQDKKRYKRFPFTSLVVKHLNMPKRRIMLIFQKNRMRYRAIYYSSTQWYLVMSFNVISPLSGHQKTLLITRVIISPLLYQVMR